MLFQRLPAADPELFSNLINLLESKPLPVNEYRKNSGRGRSQCFGIVKQRDFKYAGSRQNYLRVDILDELQRIARTILPEGFTWDGCQLNQNYQTAPHKDNGNRGTSCIVGCGEYQGGYLNIEGTEVDIKYTPILFDGSRYTHSTSEYNGNRITLVFFRVARDFAIVPTYRKLLLDGKDVLHESMDGLERIIDDKGQILWSSDGSKPSRKKAKYILLAAK